MYHFRGDLSTSANHCLSWVSGKESGSCCNGGCTTSLKIRRVRQHRLWLEKVSVNMLPFTLSHISNVFVENVTCFPGSTFWCGKSYPRCQNTCFRVGLCVHEYCIKPGIWTGMIFFAFHLHLLWLGRGEPSQPGHILLHHLRRQLLQELAPVCHSGLKMCHIQRVGGLLAVGGSTTLAVQRNRSSCGVAWDLQMTCWKWRADCKGFSNLSLGVCLRCSQSCVAASARLPALN